MAITNVTISQTNIVEGAELLACHNPLIFLITATYTDTPPAWCKAFFFIDGVEMDNFNCLYLRDESATERTFYLVADEILRGYLGKLSNFDQSNETLLFCNSLSKKIDIYFQVETYYVEVFTSIYVNAARDFENINGACMVDEFQNVSKTYIAQNNEMVYLYWFNDNATNEIKIINPDVIQIYTDVAYTLFNMGFKLAELYPDNLTNTTNVAGKLWYARNLIAETFEFQTGVFSTNYGTITNVVSDIPYTLTEIITNGWELKFDLSANPTDGDSFSFDYTLVGYPTVSISATFETPDSYTFEIGFIRYALKPTVSTTFNELSINDVVYPHNIIVRNECPGYVLLRYADRNGQYRIMPFSKYYSRTVNPELIGEINQLVLSLKNDSGDTRPVGYRNRDTLKLTAQNLTEPEYTLLKDLFNSPDVEAYINGKWLRVRVQGDNIVKLEKRKLKDVTITVELPTSYNITEL